MTDRPERERYWLTRHYVAASTLVTLLIATLAPDSLNAKALNASGPPAWWVVSALGLISLIVLFDSILNAVAPRYAASLLRRHRHMLFMAMAVGQLCLGYAVIAYAPNNATLMLRFSLDATVAASVAFLDLFSRHRLDRLS